MDYRERRDRAQIYAEILEKIHNTSLSGEKPTVTRIQTGVNVPFVRFKEYTDDMHKKGLIVIEPNISITEEGMKYLEDYKKVREFLNRFGLVGPSKE